MRLRRVRKRNLCVRNLSVRNLSVRNLCVRNLCVRNLSVRNLSVRNLRYIGPRDGPRGSAVLQAATSTLHDIRERSEFGFAGLVAENICGALGPRHKTLDAYQQLFGRLGG